MRIVGGAWRGRTIEALEGRDVTRPTTDRTREAMASMLLSAFDLDLEGVVLLDAFAGSGAIGLELLSRGAQRCVFVDANRKAAACVRRNVGALGVDRESARVLCGDVCKLAARGRIEGGPFDLVVLDPPYALDAAVVSKLVRDLYDGESLLPGAWVLYEHSSRGPGLDVPGIVPIRSRTRGTTSTDLLRFAEPEGD